MEHKKNHSKKEAAENLKVPPLGDVLQTSIVKELLKNLEDKQKEAADYKDSMLRTLADLENYRKRTQRERAEIRSNTIAEIMETFLPVLDNFEFGLAAAERHGASGVTNGFQIIFTNFKNLLASYGVQEIFPLNEKFDPNFHECVRREVDNSKQSDTIVAVDRKGYLLNSKLLRPAIVAVSCHDEQQAAAE